MFKSKKALLPCTTAAALGAGIMLFNSYASADLFSECARKPGSTRFFDFATDKCGYVFSDNRNWGALPGGWNDRADQFGNDGNTSSNCLYQNINCGGTSVLLQRGFAVDWSNIVSSNRWTTASSCVTSC
jgi:hypothetical protein